MAQDDKSPYETLRRLVFDVVEEPRYFVLLAFLAILFFSGWIYSSSGQGIWHTLILAGTASGAALGVRYYFKRAPQKKKEEVQGEGKSLFQGEDKHEKEERVEDEQ